MRPKFYLICLFILCAYLSPVFGQSYGLGFAGQEVVQDKRTGLDLSAEKSLCFDESFTLSFDIGFIPGYSDYFGYIFRIIDEGKRNIDLIYDKSLQTSTHFKLIIGDHASDIAFDIPLSSLYKNWHRITVTFNKDTQQIMVSVHGKIYSQSINIANTCYKILFGASNYKEFRATDVPPMKIRRLNISKKGKVYYQWLLNESEGNVAHEEKRAIDAAVSNPLWLKKQHYDWQHIQSFEIGGAASFAFNPEDETLYIVSKDSLGVYDVPLRKLSYIPYEGKPLHLLPGNQSLFDTLHNRLLNFYLDEKLVTAFDFNEKQWSQNYSGPDTVTNYWHPNKFYQANENALYVIGGYGHFAYHRMGYRYRFQEKTWEKFLLDEPYIPRYLAALGTSTRGIYILGGYGSSTGKQILNPKNIYDLSVYDAKNNRFKTLYHFTPKNEDFAFANSMVIDESKRLFYALSFPNHRYNSHLQLIRGALDTAQYELVGSEIPYTFHDINSFADLYYCPTSKVFVAVTMLFNLQTDKSQVNIYTLLAPPKTVAQLLPSNKESANQLWYLVMSALLLVGLGCWYYKGRKRQRIKKHPLEQAMASQPTEAEPLLSAPSKEQKIPIDKIKNSILLFGDFQLFDAEGNDITKHFTPLIKELFLVILLYTLLWERGVSTEKLTELLWFDKSAESARNNRSVNIAKLKSILEKLDGGQISRETGYWKFNFNDALLYIDFYEYLKIIKQKRSINKADIVALGKITQRGGFLTNIEYDWLDIFKSETSNEIIDTYLQFAMTLDASEDPETLIHMANNICYFDAVNEEAMVMKCKALVSLGKHSLAKTSFEHFRKDYAAIYGEEFDRSFQEILQ